MATSRPREAMAKAQLISNQVAEVPLGASGAVTAEPRGPGWEWVQPCLRSQLLLKEKKMAKNSTHLGRAVVKGQADSNRSLSGMQPVWQP